MTSSPPATVHVGRGGQQRGAAPALPLDTATTMSAAAMSSQKTESSTSRLDLRTRRITKKQTTSAQTMSEALSGMFTSDHLNHWTKRMDVQARAM